MNNYISKTIFIFFVSTLFFASNISSEILDDAFDWKRLEGSKLGYYVGSFDPIHLGHQNVIQQALESHVDYVLIYPAPGSDHIKNRTDLSIRQKLIASIYQGHPKVLMTYWNPKELQDKFNTCAVDLDIIGIIGSDVVSENLMGPDKEWSEKYRSIFMRGIPLKEKYYQNSAGALMALEADSFLVALRGNIDLSHLENHIYDRPIRAFIQSKNYSSTEVRNAIRNKQSFEQFVSFSVQAIIKEDGLYGFSSQFNKALHDELIEMEEADQKARFNLINNKFPSEDLCSAVQRVDTQNRERLKSIIDQYGWPGVSLVGLKGSSAIWLLVQHQDNNIDFQKQCLELLKNAVNQYEASSQSLAYLTDRVNVNEGRPQIYGTQWLQVDGNFTLYAVEDIEHLDQRRSQMGLCIIAEYKKQLMAILNSRDSNPQGSGWLYPDQNAQESA